VNVLVVARLYPWPAVDGYRQRLENMIRALTSVSTVDLFCAEPDAPNLPGPPESIHLGEVVTAPMRSVASRMWMRSWLRSEQPRRIASVDWSESRRELAAWDPRPDLVWYSLLDTWVSFGDLLAGIPSIVDFDNLENLRLRQRRRSPTQFAPGATAGQKVAESARWMASRSMDVVDERRWDSSQGRCADSVDRVVVCSELDVDRSGCANAVAVPNGAHAPEVVDADRRELRGASPTMVFVGALDYEPNTDAVEWMAREVLPLVRVRLPGAVLRIVGRGAETVKWVDDLPGVDLVGEVADLRPELDRADVSVVPIRLGAGTRLKIVEALAHHIPLVTTSVGAEGIDVVDGEHALVADDERRFADACLRLLSDGTERQRLADRGAELFEASYTWDAIGERVASIASAVVD
jgi:glycosyltransferase involved in cell wall biosynthesis